MEKQIQIKLPSQRQWYGPNYLLIAVLFLLPVILFILGVILFLNSSPPAFNETKRNISASVPVQNLSPALPGTHKLAERVSEDAEQPPDLRKQAGNLFGYVFDEGVFSEPSNAHASHDFFMDQESKTILLRLNYDVSLRNSFAGIYFKTHSLDLSKVKRISFLAKSGEEKLFPDRFRIEFKDQSSSVRRFSVTPVAYDWHLYEFDFNVDRPTNISEVAFIFENTKVGTLAAAGTVYLKDLTIQ